MEVEGRNQYGVDLPVVGRLTSHQARPIKGYIQVGQYRHRARVERKIKLKGLVVELFHKGADALRHDAGAV